MARAPRRPRSTAEEGAEPPAHVSRAPGVLITFRENEIGAALSVVSNAAGIKSAAFSSDYPTSAVDMAETGRDMVVFESLGVAVAAVDPDQAASISSLSFDDSAVLSIEPEPIFFAFGADNGGGDDYWRGYRDGVEDVSKRAGAVRRGAQFVPGGATATLADTQAATWGLQAIGALSVGATGKGVKIAILDTGLDLVHVDFRGRAVTSKSFIPGQAVDDLNGHGTHCAGTACGPLNPQRGPRYGVAPGAEIFIGKVLSNQGSELAGSTLAGIEWARQQGCQIISMSLGGRVKRGERYLNAFEQAARRALRGGSLIIAAAGNDSRRSRADVRPVSHPANCPSILAVGARRRTFPMGRSTKTARSLFAVLASALIRVRQIPRRRGSRRFFASGSPIATRSTARAWPRRMSPE